LIIDYLVYFSLIRPRLEVKEINPGIAAQITCVYARDLDSTAEFYVDKLQLKCLRESADARIFETAGNAAIGLCRVFADRVVEPKGGMISIVTGDVDAWYRRLIARGLQVDEPQRRLRHFAIYSFFVRDPNGYVIEFQQFD